MKSAFCLVAILGCAFALPTKPTLDWSKIHPLDAFVEPINDISGPTGRVVGGTEAEPNSHPYQAAVIIDGSGFCGGSLISTNWILTAAHCTISASYVQVILGAHSVRDLEPTQVVLTSTNIINHSGYIGSTLTNDVALILLPFTVTLSDEIRPLTLAPVSSGTFAGSTAVLSGWGRTSEASNVISPTLQRVTLSVITNAVCSSTYGSLIVDSTICTSGAGVVGGCNGDSGGPLVVNEVQVGVASFVSARGCESGLPTGYARVSSFRNWIADNAGI